MSNAYQVMAPVGSGPTDLLLVQAALGGDAAAIDALMVRLGCVPRFVHRLNRSLGHGLTSDALEDVVQQVYAALWPRLAEFHGRNTLETWVFVYCRNCVRSAARRVGRSPRAVLSDEMLAAIPAAVEGPMQKLDRNEVLGALQDELERLPVAEREVVQARHLEGRSFEDLARATGVAVSTIKDRCYRAMQRLEENLGRRMIGG
ncbi:MAG: RNA polymerase sigma factor [Planctomycetes bacterium]|nr:RNA polymerase sigma factor [Planctomycetota bacterium]